MKIRFITTMQTAFKFLTLQIRQSFPIQFKILLNVKGFVSNIKRTFNKEYQYRWNVKYPNVKKLHYQTETVGSGSLTILEPSTKIIDIQQPGTYDYNVALGGGDTTYTIEGNQRGPSSVSGWLVFKKFSVRNGIKYLDEYSSEGWTLCEE